MLDDNTFMKSHTDLREENAQLKLDIRKLQLSHSSLCKMSTQIQDEYAQLKAELQKANFDTLHARASLEITTEQRDLWLQMLDECLVESEQLKAELAQCRETIATFHQSNLDKIRKAAQEGSIQIAPSEVVDYLEQEVSALFPLLGVRDAFVTDQSRVRDFPNGDNLPQMYIWQFAILKLRERLTNEQQRAARMREAITLLTTGEVGSFLTTRFPATLREAKQAIEEVKA